MKIYIKTRIRDPLGAMMVLFLCAIVWYRDFVTKYVQISNMLLILGLGLVGVVVLDAVSKRDNRTFLNFPTAFYLITAYMLLTFLFGFFVTPSLSAHMSEGMTYVEFTIIMLCICYYAKTRGSTMFLVYNYALLYTLMTIIFLVDPVLVNDGEVLRYSFSQDMNSNAFAMILATGCWSLLYLTSVGKVKIWISAIVCGIMVYASFMTGSRKGVLGLVIVIAGWVILCYLRPVRGVFTLKKLKRIGVIVVLMVVAVSVLMPYFEGSAVASRLKAVGTDGSSLERMDMYSTGMEYIKQSPLFGYGYGGFKYFYGKYSHSTWVETFVCAGIPLAVMYFISYFNLLGNLVRLGKKKIRNKLSMQTDVSIQMHTVLFIVLMFYSISIIHIYNINSFYSFAMIMMSCAGAKKEIREYNQNKEKGYVSQK